MSLRPHLDAMYADFQSQLDREEQAFTRLLRLIDYTSSYREKFIDDLDGAVSHGPWMERYRNAPPQPLNETPEHLLQRLGADIRKGLK
jgi:hypothetical protein